MARMSDNDKCPSRYFDDSSQLTNWILDLGAMCHIMQEFQDSLEDTDKHIEVSDINQVMAKQKIQVPKRIRNSKSK